MSWRRSPVGAIPLDTATMYAYVQDVAAEWDTYESVARSLGDAPPAGMIIRVAGATTEGFRVIDVWESRSAWEQFRELRLRPAMRLMAGDASPRLPTFVDIDVRHAIVNPLMFGRIEPWR